MTDLEWAKKRALAYLPNNPKEALGSFMSDLSKLERDYSTVQGLGMMLLLGGHLETAKQVEDFINGTN